MTVFSARKPECVGHKGWIQVGNKSLYFGLRPQQNYSLALEHWDLVHIYAIVLLFPFGLFFFFFWCMFPYLFPLTNRTRLGVVGSPVSRSCSATRAESVVGTSKVFFLSLASRSRLPCYGHRDTGLY